MQTKKKWSFQLDGLRRHKLMTKVIAEKVPKLNETEDHGYQAEVVVKYFSPYTGYTFFVTEFDGDDVLFGYCLSPAGPDCDEWGYASLRELAGLVVYGTVPAIERDMHYGPKKVGEAIEEVRGFNPENDVLTPRLGEED